jgi:hypothetical protein
MIITIDGVDYDARPAVADVLKRGLKSVKNTPGKYNFSVEFKEIANTNELDIGYMWAGLVDKATAAKLGAVIAAVVEGVTGDIRDFPSALQIEAEIKEKIFEAREAFKESMDA